MTALPFLLPQEQKALNRFVRELYRRYGQYVRSVILFGSKARGDSGPDSDIDLLVALSSDDPYLRSEIRQLAAYISLEYDLLLSVQAVSRSRWEKLSRYRFPLYQAVMSEGIPLTPQPA